MNNQEFYEAIFGLKIPWEVKDVRLDVEKQQVEGKRDAELSITHKFRPKK